MCEGQMENAGSLRGAEMSGQTDRSGWEEGSQGVTFDSPLSVGMVLTVQYSHIRRQVVSKT